MNKIEKFEKKYFDTPKNQAKAKKRIDKEYNRWLNKKCDSPKGHLMIKIRQIQKIEAEINRLTLCKEQLIIETKKLLKIKEV